jgi:hypothetical protein
LKVEKVRKRGAAEASLLNGEKVCKSEESSLEREIGAEMVHHLRSRVRRLR